MEQLRKPDAPTEFLADLYAAHARRLRRIVASGVRAPDAVIDDACQVAWSRLIPRAASVRPESSLAWLVTTASREAIKLSRRGEREISLEALIDDDVQFPGADGPEITVAWRERLDTVRSLPVRQQQLVWLAGLGLSYEEMADYTRSSRRTVERQLLRAKHTLRDAA
jgi:RNA polymerase sigma factor (sigma-70 family)